MSNGVSTLTIIKLNPTLSWLFNLNDIPTGGVNVTLLPEEPRTILFKLSKDKTLKNKVINFSMYINKYIDVNFSPLNLTYGNDNKTLDAVELYKSGYVIAISNISTGNARWYKRID